MLEILGPVTRTIAVTFAALTLTAGVSGVYVGAQILTGEPASAVSTNQPTAVNQPLAAS